MTPVGSGRAELFRALGALAEPPTPEHARLAEALGLPGRPDGAEYAQIFLLNLYPYASAHLGPDGMLGGEARDRVAGFWRALAVAPPSEPDHLGALLGLLAALAEREDGIEEGAERALLAQARAALVHEHILPWLPVFLLCVREWGSPFYAAWAELLDEALAEERGRTALADRELPVHLRALDPIPDPRSGEEGAGEAFVRALLAPARSGMLLTRQDLDHAGLELGLGVRIGERAYVLKALLSQDARATLAWLAAEARRWAGVHGDMQVNDEVVAGFWRDRAQAAAGLLDELASTEVGEERPMESRHA